MKYKLISTLLTVNNLDCLLFALLIELSYNVINNRGRLQMKYIIYKYISTDINGTLIDLVAGVKDENNAISTLTLL